LSSKFKPERTVIKGSSLIGAVDSGLPSQIECSDGKIVRIRPYHYDNEQTQGKKWKMEARGTTFSPPDRSLLTPYGITYKSRVYSNNRVRWPLKRVDWDPDGERNPQNRGISKFVRISWEEASRLIAGELKRVKEAYGTEAILCQSDGHGEGKHISPCHGSLPRLLAQLGPYTMQVRNLDSWEGWHLGARHVWGMEPVGQMLPMANLYPDIAKHCDMLLFWGCDPETTPLGIVGHMTSRLCQWFRQLGLKAIYIDPAMTFGAAVYADKWIPVLPNTDAALQLAVAYTWITEETFEKEYIDTHAHGYEKFADYVLGKEDGVPKTPEWAAPKCGVPEWTIKALARDWAKKTVSIMHGNGGSFIRGPYATEPARLEVILLGMRGLGKPGVHQAKVLEWNFGGRKQTGYPLPYQAKDGVIVPKLGYSSTPVPADVDDDFRVKHGDLGPAASKRSPKLAEFFKFTGSLPAQSIPRCRIHDAILDEHIEFWGGQFHPNRQQMAPGQELISTTRYQFRKIEFPRPGLSRIRMIWNDAPCNVTCWNDGNRYIRAMQSPELECVVTQQPWLENDCYFSDLVLPVSTKHEMVDICDDPSSGVYSSVYLEDKSCEPVGESMSDFRICALIAKELGPGVYERYAGDMSDEEMVREYYRASGAEDIMSWEEINEKKVCVLPLDDEISEMPAGLYEFYKDPKNNPLTTPTGLLEFCSTELEKYMPDDAERPPVPHWIESGPAHDERLSSQRVKEYPLLCMSNHGRWRMHAQLDDVIWMREVETMKIRAKDGYQYEPLWIHPSEAESRGISHGDIVKIFNERGTVLAAAYITERLIPHTCYIDHGARIDPIIPGVLERGGCINCITPTNTTSSKAVGMATSGFLVEVKKVADEEMEGWKRDYPEAFARKLDYAAGVCLDGWLDDK